MYCPKNYFYYNVHRCPLSGSEELIKNISIFYFIDYFCFNYLGFYLYYFTVVYIFILKRSIWNNYINACDVILTSLTD